MLDVGSDVGFLERNVVMLVSLVIPDKMFAMLEIVDRSVRYWTGFFMFWTGF